MWIYSNPHITSNQTRVKNSPFFRKLEQKVEDLVLAAKYHINKLYYFTLIEEFI